MKAPTFERRIHFNGHLCRDLYGSYASTTGDLLMIYDIEGTPHWIKGGILPWPTSCPADAAHMEATPC